MNQFPVGKESRPVVVKRGRAADFVYTWSLIPGAEVIDDQEQQDRDLYDLEQLAVLLNGWEAA